MNKLLLIILAVVLPPIAVGLVKGWGVHFVVNILLWVLSLGILGIIHGLYVVLTSDGVKA